MSSTNRGAKRADHDQYFTPSWCIHRFLERFELPDGPILDPCCGMGAIVRGVQFSKGPEISARWYAREIDKKFTTVLEDLLPGRVWMGDFLSSSSVTCEGASADWPGRFSLVMTNPPFSLAEEVLYQGLKVSDTVALLLSMHMVGSEKRSSLLRRFPPDMYVLPERPSFTENGKTDSVNYAWCVWDKRNESRTEGKYCMLKSTPVEIRRPKKPKEPKAVKKAAARRT